MGIRIGLISILVLTLALAMVTVSSSYSLGSNAMETHLSRGDGGLSDLKSCDGNIIGDCIDEDEEMMTMDPSESTRRTLAGRRRYVSYRALKRNAIPCNRRGRSYYQCSGHQRANPYTRGCGRISRCARNTR